MLRDLLSSKLFLGCFGLFVLFAVGCFLWYQHETMKIQKEGAESAEIRRQSELSQKVDTLKSAGKTDVVKTRVPAPQKQETPSIEAATVPDAVTENTSDVPKTVLSETDATENTEVRVSPHGLGPYPEVPEDFIFGSGPWQDGDFSLGQELISRVLIKLWNDGDRNFRGATFENGKVYVYYPNQVHVRYDTVKNPDGTTTRYIAGWSSTGDIPQPTLEQQLSGYIPPAGVEIIDLDIEDPGIEPYSFLGLHK